MRILLAVFIAAMVAGFYFTPMPEPAESRLHYILAGRTTWPEMTCIVIASFAAAALLMTLLMRSPSDT